MLIATWVTDPAVLPALADRWNSLADATDSGSAFLRHEWFSAAWRWRSSSCQLSTLLVSRGDELIGVLPLVREHVTGGGAPGDYVRSLDVPDTQQFSLLCSAENSAAVAATAGTALAAIAGGHDELQLRKLYSTAANNALIKVLLHQPRTKVDTADACPCVGLQATWTDYYATRSRRLKKGNNLEANKLKKAFRSIAVTRELLDGSPAGNNLMTELLELSTFSWKRDLETAIHRPQAKAWIEALRSQPALATELCVWCLRLDGMLAAAELQLERDGQISALRAEAREDLNAFGPGTYLNWKMLESLLGSGRRLYNMGPGLSEYKERWSDMLLQPMVVTQFGARLRGRRRWLMARYLAPVHARLVRLLGRGGPR